MGAGKPGAGERLERIIQNFDLIIGEARSIACYFADLLRELQERGVPVAVELRDSKRKIQHPGHE